MSGEVLAEAAEATFLRTAPGKLSGGGPPRWDDHRLPLGGLLPESPAPGSDASALGLVVDGACS